MTRTAADPATPNPSRGRRFLQSAWLPSLLGLLCMANSIGNDFTYDDVPAVRENPRIRSLLDLRAVWLSNWWEATGESEAVNLRREPLYRPLTVFTLAVNHAVTGPGPTGFHAANVLLHALACLLVWHFTRRLLDDPAVASVAATLFAVHPVHAEAVASIVGRAEILAAAFLMLGLIALMPRHGRPRWPQALLAAVFFFLALLAKETAICFPAVALLVLYARGARGNTTWRWWLMHALWLLVPLLLYFPLRYVALDGRLFRSEPAGNVMNPLVLAQGFERVLAALAILGHYIRLLIVPAQLSCDYGLAVVDPRRGFTPMAWLGLAAAVAALVGLLGLVRGRTWWRQIGVLTAIALASYALISNTVLLIGVSLAERLMYWPSAPLLAIAAIGVVEFWRRQVADGKLFAVLGALFVVALAVRTAVRNADWATTFDLTSRDVRNHPQSAHLQRGYAQELMKLAVIAPDAEQQRELLEEADRRLETALQIEPRFTDALALRGSIRAEFDDIDAAFQFAEAALRLDPHHADALRLYTQLAGGPGAAERHLAPLQARVDEHPDDPEARIALGRALLGLGRPVEARQEFERAAELAPESTEPLRLLGDALALSGRSDEAVEVMRRVLARTPDDWRVHANLSALLAKRDAELALKHALRAYELEPNDERSCVNLAEAYKNSGRLREALEMHRRVLAMLDRDDPFRAVVENEIAEIQRSLD